MADKNRIVVSEMNTDDAREVSDLTSWRGLHVEDNAEEMIRSHEAAEQYWHTRNDLREKTHDYTKGKTWSNEELRLLKNKKKAPISFNKIITSVRTIVGTFINNKYDIKFAPFEPRDQDISDILKELYAYQYHAMNLKYKDPDVIQEAIIGGDCWQECYMDILPGQKPRMVIKNQNPFAIYPDPNSMDLVERTDCEFIDRVGWFTLAKLQDMFPDQAIEIYDSLYYAEDRTDGSYENVKRSSDRTHESQTELNGKFKVIERFYRVRKRLYFGVDQTGERFDIGLESTEDIEIKKDEFKNLADGNEVFDEPFEMLWYAVACPQYRHQNFLYNGLYHNQPRDPVTKRIMFPLYQLVCESVGSEINGFVEYMMDPNKYINAMVGNQLHAAKHSASTSLLINVDKFEEKELRDIEKHHADGDRTFRTKTGESIDGAVDLLPVGNTNQDTNNVLSYASDMVEQFVPPSFRGAEAGSGVSGKLNAQQIAQAQIQIVPVINNFKHFSTKRAKLMQYYNMTYMTEEEKIRITGEKHETDPDHITLNEMYLDEGGQLAKWNDLNLGLCYLLSV